MDIWHKAEACGARVLELVQGIGPALPHKPNPVVNFGWISSLHASNRIRRAHVDIIDARETHKLWIMHCCIFPHVNDTSPIFGFDIISGPSRISGAFLDFSTTGIDDHPMMQWFDQRVTNLNWKKERQLPDWAAAIFSPAMVAAGAITDEKEVDQLTSLGIECLEYYLAHVGHQRNDHKDSYHEQNNYCINQKRNPHTPRTMAMLGLTPDQVTEFFEHLMFPNI